MDLSEIEKDILEKASAPGGTNYRNHDMAAADFIEIAESLVEKRILYKEIININETQKIQIYKNNR
jgi:hypothetical protein